MITVVSLGTRRGELTLRGRKALAEADAVFVRTADVPSVGTLDEEGIAYRTLDGLYERSRTYDTFVKKAVAEIGKSGRTGRVCYCVDGSPSEDAAARILIAEKGAEAIDGPGKAARLALAAGVSD